MATPTSTLHRLLGWRPDHRSRFRHDRANQLPHNVVIVDECSMVGLSLMARLLDAVRPTARLVLVGDLASSPGRGGCRPRRHRGVAAARHRRAAPRAPLRRGHRHRRRRDRVGGRRRGGRRPATAGDDVTWRRSADADPTTAPELRAVRCGRHRPLGGRAAASAGDAGCAHRPERGPGALRPPPQAGRCRQVAAGDRALAALDDPGLRRRRLVPGPAADRDRERLRLGVFNGDTGVVVDVGGGRLQAVPERRGEPLLVRPTRLAAVDSCTPSPSTRRRARSSATSSCASPAAVAGADPRAALHRGHEGAAPAHRARHRGRGAGRRRPPVARASGLTDALAAGDAPDPCRAPPSGRSVSLGHVPIGPDPPLP
ncbi:MAG: AAA family ATPase [Microthrixaceae bacterium]|nr:AAA family ATPase [Microthrixaceae bacterium]